MNTQDAFKEKLKAKYDQLVAEAKTASADARLEAHQQYGYFQVAKDDFETAWNNLVNAAEDQAEAAQSQAEAKFNELEAKWQELKSSF